MNNYEKLEYIHAALQESDQSMIEQAMVFVEDLRESHMALDAKSVDIECDLSETDGALVMFINTDDDVMPCNADGPTGLRVYINDGDLYDN
jgi:hypothetical protein